MIKVVCIDNTIGNARHFCSNIEGEIKQLHRQIVLESII